MIKQLIAAFILATGVSYAQDYRTGDADFDASLKLVNTNAKENLSDFKSDLSKRFSVELSKVETCFTSGMNPGDAFMAFQIASVNLKDGEKWQKNWVSNRDLLNFTLSREKQRKNQKVIQENRQLSLKEVLKKYPIKTVLPKATEIIPESPMETQGKEKGKNKKEKVIE
jgi:hypothetical protein